MILQRVEVTVAATEPADEDFEDTFDLVADAFYAATDVFDQSLGGNAEEWSLTFSMGVADVDATDALIHALAVARAALHAANGSTPGWDTHFEVIRSSTERAAKRPDDELVVA